MTESLAKKSNGAELLSRCLTAFFTPLIDLINAYRGDTIKFSGDALTIYFPSVDDTKSPAFNGIVPPHGSFGLEDLGPMATSVLRASACCIEIHKRLHMFETGGLERNQGKALSCDGLEPIFHYSQKISAELLEIL